MSSFEHGARELLRSPDVGARFAGFKDLVDHLSGTDEDGGIRVQDVYQQSYLLALRERLGNPEYPATNFLYAYELAEYPDRSLLNIVNNGIRCGNAYWLDKGWPPDPDALGRLRDPEAWSEYFYMLENDPMERADFDLYFQFNIQTNFPKRYALPVAAAKLLGIIGPQRIMDIGCSRNFGLTYAALDKRQYPYEKIEVVERSDEDGAVTPNAQATAKFMQLINSNFHIAEGIGIDIQDEEIKPSLRNQRLRRWASNCFYLSEYIANLERIFDIMLLEDQRLPQIKFFQGDITHFEHDVFRKAHPGFEADIVLLSTVGNQLGQLGTRAAFENTAPYMRSVETPAGPQKKGLRMLLDFVDVHPDGQLQYLTKSWPPFSYRLYVEDLSRPELGLQHFFTAENGRVPRIILERAAARLAVERGFNLSAASTG